MVHIVVALQNPNASAKTSEHTTDYNPHLQGKQGGQKKGHDKKQEGGQGHGHGQGQGQGQNNDSPFGQTSKRGMAEARDNKKDDGKQKKKKDGEYVVCARNARKEAVKTEVRS